MPPASTVEIRHVILAGNSREAAAWCLEHGLSAFDPHVLVIRRATQLQSLVHHAFTLHRVGSWQRRRDLPHVERMLAWLDGKTR